MKYLRILAFLLITSIGNLFAQGNIYPAPEYNGTIAITSGTIHVGNGEIIPNGTIIISNGRIQTVGGNNLGIPVGAKLINANGKHVYPGLIAMSTNLGLAEISSINAGNDFAELGDMNPSVRTIMAYNAQSQIIPTIRSNGVLLAHIVPRGGIISGTSSIVQLDAWDWRDASYKMNNGIHLNMPALVNRPRGFGGFNRNTRSANDVLKEALNKIEDIRIFFREAKIYQQQIAPLTNLKYDAVKGLFNKSQKLFVHCDLVKEMMMAIDFKKEFGFDMVIVGGADSWLMADVLKENEVPVILSEPHSLPSTPDDAVDQPYKTGAQLAQAGVLFSFAIENDNWQQRCIPFQAGTMAAYGLSKEDALKAISLNAAKILGIDQMTGSIEVGKDANIIISEGDVLDMKSSIITTALIKGREINLDNKQTQLFEKYKYKYGIK